MPPPVLPEIIWRDFVDPNSRLSGAYQPSKDDIIGLLRWMLDALDALGAATGTDPTIIANLSTRLNQEIDRAKAAELAEANTRAGADQEEANARVLADAAIGERIDTTNTRTAEVRPQPAGMTMLWSFLQAYDTGRRKVVAVTERLEWFMARARVGRLPDRFAYVGGLFDGRGRALAGVRPDGRLSAVLDPAAYAHSRSGAALNPRRAIELGAQGNVSEVMVLPGPGRRLGYLTDADGVSAFHVVRRDRLMSSPPTWHMRRPGPRLDAFISYGQSWRSFMYDVAGLGLLGAGESRRVGAFCGLMNGAVYDVPTQGSAAGTDIISDFAGLGPATQTGIGRAAAMGLQRLRARDGSHIDPVVDMNPSYPGYRWDQLKPGTSPWTYLVAQVAKLRTIAPFYGVEPRWRGIGWTHGAPEDGGVDGNGVVIDYAAVLAEMRAAFDGLALNGVGGDPLHFFTDQTAPVASRTQAQAAILTQAAFALADASRVHLIGPRYPYPFQDDIHHTDLGTVMIGDLEGYVKHVVLDLGQAWTPARPTGVAVSGKVVTITVARPYGMGNLALDTALIEPAPQYGFHVKVGGSEIAVSGIALGTDTITLTLASAVASGASAEVSYAFYGPGAANGTHSGVWGNVKRIGPPSTLLPNRTIDTWLTVFRQSVTAA